MGLGPFVVAAREGYAGSPLEHVERPPMTDETLFDDWPERYDHWFSTPIGRLVKEIESRLILDLLSPVEGEKILDAGCGNGVFTLDFLEAGAMVIGLDISEPMLAAATHKAADYPFVAVRGDMLSLPFVDGAFDKAVSVTALEFIEDGRRALAELFRVTRPGGLVVVATLNRLSPWAARRRAKTERGESHVLENAFFRSPRELLALAPVTGTATSVVHFQKDDSPEEAEEIERVGQAQGLDTGAFVAARWTKPR
jgi:ubiquinone/menaquinone biosynthesis C-methylase UbiE